MPSYRRHLKAVTPPADHDPTWRRLLNVLYLHEEDVLFVWLRDSVRPAVREWEKRSRAA